MSRWRSRRFAGFAVPILASLLLRANGAGAARSAVKKGPYVQRVTADSAQVRVEVDPPSPVTVELAPAEEAGDAGHRSFTSAEPSAFHAIPITGLRPATRYTYTVRTGGATKAASFVTAPPEDSEAAFHFLVYGDNRSDDAGHAAVVRAMVTAQADFLVHTGDFVEDAASPTDWQTFFDIESPLLSRSCVYSAVGNHELTDGAALEYIKYFGPNDAQGPGRPSIALHPELLDGTFRWGDTRFFVINGLGRWSGGPERTWLESALTAADTEKNLKWRILVTHEGPWSSGPHGSNVKLLEAGIVDLLKAHHVDLVIAGHDHHYERGWGDDLAYIVSGGGGAPTYKIKNKIPQARTVESVRHFVDVAVSRSSLQITAIRADGSTIERCALPKEMKGWDCDSAPVPTTQHVAPPPTTRGQKCKCDAVGVGGPRSPEAAGAAIVVGLLVVRRRRRR